MAIAIRITEKFSVHSKDDIIITSSRVVREGLTANVKVTAVLGLIPASSDTVKSEGRQLRQC
jgi:hypothetical protein